MKIILFYQSVLSDWNHGNAHFLRGYASELLSRGNDVVIYEPEDSWCYRNLINDHGQEAVAEFYSYYPLIKVVRYDPDSINLEKILRNADLVIVHEWNTHKLVKKIGGYRKNPGGFKLLFHDTHHRIISDRENMLCYDLKYYDGVLAYGKTIKDIYLKERLISKAWIWHEAADTKVFHSYENDAPLKDVIWTGNWGDEERSEELLKYLINPVRELGLSCKIYGVRYPENALKLLDKAGIEYGGWLPNFKVPEEFSKFKITIHIPRRPYVEMLPGIPTIRPFEALACGIPMISSPWKDSEHLFNPGKDFLFVSGEKEMKDCIEMLISNDQKRDELAESGLSTIKEKHTCSHRIDQLYEICEELGIKHLSL